MRNFGRDTRTRLYLGVPSTAHGDVPLQAPFFLELRSEVVRLRPLPVGEEGSNKNCRTVKICRRSKPITNFGNRWSLSPWRTNRRSRITSPSANESGRSLFPSVVSQFIYHKHGKHIQPSPVSFMEFYQKIENRCLYLLIF